MADCNDLNYLENDNSSDNEININQKDILNYRGYFVQQEEENNEEEEEPKYFENGAHFPYDFLYQQLEILIQDGINNRNDSLSSSLSTSSKKNQTKATGHENTRNLNQNNFFNLSRNNNNAKSRNRKNNNINFTEIPEPIHNVGLTFMPKMQIPNAEEINNHIINENQEINPISNCADIGVEPIKNKSKSIQKNQTSKNQKTNGSLNPHSIAVRDTYKSKQINKDHEKGNNNWYSSFASKLKMNKRLNFSKGKNNKDKDEKKSVNKTNFSQSSTTNNNTKSKINNSNNTKHKDNWCKNKALSASMNRKSNEINKSNSKTKSTNNNKVNETSNKSNSECLSDNKVINAINKGKCDINSNSKILTNSWNNLLTSYKHKITNFSPKGNQIGSKKNTVKISTSINEHYTPSKTILGKDKNNNNNNNNNSKLVLGDSRNKISLGNEGNIGNNSVNITHDSQINRKKSRNINSISNTLSNHKSTNENKTHMIQLNINTPHLVNNSQMLTFNKNNTLIKQQQPQPKGKEMINKTSNKPLVVSVLNSTPINKYNVKNTKQAPKIKNYLGRNNPIKAQKVNMHTQIKNSTQSAYTNITMNLYNKTNTQITKDNGALKGATSTENTKSNFQQQNFFNHAPQSNTPQIKIISQEGKVPNTSSNTQWNKNSQNETVKTTSSVNTRNGLGVNNKTLGIAYMSMHWHDINNNNNTNKKRGISNAKAYDSNNTQNKNSMNSWINKIQFCCRNNGETRKTSSVSRMKNGGNNIPIHTSGTNSNEEIRKIVFKKTKAINNNVVLPKRGGSGRMSTKVK